MANIILPTFEALSNDVLARCLQSGTQNQNEAFNVLIWQHATKKKPYCLVVVELAAYLAVFHFNDGAMSIMFSPTVSLEFIQDFIVFRHKSKKMDCNRLHHSSRKRSQRCQKGGENSSAISKKATMSPSRPEKDSSMKLVPSKCVLDT